MLEVKIEVDEEAACTLLRARFEIKNRFHGEPSMTACAGFCHRRCCARSAWTPGSNADEHGRAVFSET